MATELANARARLQAVDKKARALYDALDPIAARYEFERAPRPSETSGAPLVLILGNHSSGKSTFVNFLLGVDVQKTGLAPIDDGFTIIAHGEAAEKDGAAVVRKGHTAPTPVRLGGCTPQSCVVEEGLAEGDDVLLP